jgi:hypothetical protein
MILDLQTYRRLSKDWTSYDDDVSSALVAAQSQAEDYTGRKFELDIRTETVQVFSNGRAYPAAYPVSAVSAPSGATHDTKSILVGTGNVFPGFPWQTQPYSTVVTYTGGYAPGTVPATLQQAIARLAVNLLTAAALAVPHGATSISVGDLSIGLGSGHDPSQVIDSTTAAQLRRYRRPVALVS